MNETIDDKTAPAVADLLDGVVMFFRRIFHIHRYKTLIIYPPHNQVCDLPQCNGAGDYGFMIQCSCGHMAATKLPSTITEIFHVNSGT